MLKIPEFTKNEDQSCQLGSQFWQVSRLFELVKNLPVLEIPLDHLNLRYTHEDLTLREMVMHIKAIQDSDLSFPIILDEDGELMDGRHRIMKAMLNGEETIKAVRFDENPTPCRVED